MKRKKETFVILILIVLILFLRLPSIYEPYWYGDEGITITVGQQLRRGLTLYKEIVDNKPPLLYFLAAKTGTLSNFKALTLIWVLLSFFYFLKIARTLVPKRKFLSSLVFIFLTSTPILEGNIVNGEIYGILPMMISVHLFLRKNYFLSGVLASFAFLFKHPFFFDFLSLLVFSIFFNQIILRYSLQKASKLLAGFFLPFMATSIYFFHQKALAEFIKHAFLNNISYISWQAGSLIPHGLTIIKSLALLLLTMTLYYYNKRKSQLSKEQMLVTLWLLFSLFGATLSTRSYPHYLLEIIPSFSLMTGVLINPLKVLLFFLTLIFSIIQFNLGFKSFLDLARYYQNFFRGNSYYFYDQKVKVTYEVNDFLRRNTGPDEPIFVWSDNSLIYALSQRPPIGKYVAAYHIKKDPARKKETIVNLSSRKPRFIILTLPIKYPFPALFNLLSKEYNLIKEETGYQIYEIKN